MSKTKDKCKNCADFNAKLDFTNRAIKIKKIDIFKDNPRLFVLIIPPSVTGGDSPPGSPSGVISVGIKNMTIIKMIKTNNNTKFMFIVSIYCNTSICKKVTKPDKESSLFYSLGKLKKPRVKSVAMNLVNNIIQFMDSTGTLMIKPNHVNSDDITINANFSQKKIIVRISTLRKFNELDMRSIRLAEDLHRLLDHIGKLPNNLPIRDKVLVFSKKEKYKEALISCLEKINVAELI
ncbi:unnamed protein product [Rhizophagus irregularis]|nr:unnamed protein product [Rhizophagus irregularis]